MKAQSDFPLSPILAAADGVIPGTHEDEGDEQRWLDDIRGHLEKYWLAGFYCGDAVDNVRNSVFPLIVISTEERGLREPSRDLDAGVFNLGGKARIYDLPADLNSGM